MNPQFEDEKPFDPFNFWKGANFKLKIRMVDNFRNYDKSEFDRQQPLADDATMEKIWNSEYSLVELITEDKFKSYDKLKDRLDKILNTRGSVGSQDRPSVPQERTPNPRYQPQADDEDTEINISKDDDPDMDYFKNLAMEDDDISF